MIRGRLGLTKAIYKRLGCAIPFNKVYQAVSIIVEQVANDLVNDQVVTVRRFGTLSPHVRRSHMAHNVSTGIVRKLSSNRSVKFHPHSAFSSLIRERQERFLQIDEDKT